MIGFLLSRGGGQWAVLVLVSGLVLTWHVASERRARIEALTAAVTARDAHWREEIAAANRAVAAARDAQAAAAEHVNIAAQAEIDKLKSTLTDLEAKNAALPHPDRCGLDAQRVRLLPR